MHLISKTFIRDTFDISFGLSINIRRITLTITKGHFGTRFRTTQKS
jgi:hypothetical protein